VCVVLWKKISTEQFNFIVVWDVTTTKHHFVVVTERVLLTLTLSSPTHPSLNKMTLQETNSAMDTVTTTTTTTTTATTALMVTSHRQQCAVPSTTRWRNGVVGSKAVWMRSSVLLLRLTLLLLLLVLLLVLQGAHGFVMIQPISTTTISSSKAGGRGRGRGRLGFSSSSSCSSRSIMGSCHPRSKLSTLHCAAKPSHDSTTAASTSSLQLPDPFPQQKEFEDESVVAAVAVAGSSSSSGGGGDGRISMILFQAQKVLDPLSQTVDDATNGWALNYADLSPESESTPLGVAFLATNIAYAMAGLYLTVQGDVLLGTMLEVVSVASFTYHYTQLQAAQNLSNRTVRTALLIDYIFALSSIVLGLVYVVMDQQLPPMEGLISGVISFGFLFACWSWEQGIPYIVLHSLWHFASAYTGYIVGTSHLNHPIL
jgi:hypothetical protein